MMRAEARKLLQKDEKEDAAEGPAEEAESPGELQADSDQVQEG